MEDGMIIQFHTPSGAAAIDTETVTDNELAALGISRDLLNEEFSLLDIARAQVLLANSPDVITQPEMWELLRIFGHRLGLSN